MYALTSKLDPDKQGRVIIPDGFMRDSAHPDPLAQTMLDREVTLAGAGDRIEIWNRSDFIAHMREAILDRPSYQATLQRTFGGTSAVAGGMPAGVPTDL
jgi:DNA-binding transcriptional regulator/RsmH inhibitor MraZ